MIEQMKRELERILLGSRRVLEQCGSDSEAGRAALQIERSVRNLLGRHPECVCPECGYRFRGKGWDGIDAHWRAKHEAVMPYEKAWPLIRAGTYPVGTGSRDPDLFGRR